MASATADTELLTEHLSYPPVSLIDDIINSVNLVAEKALDSVEKGMLSTSPSNLGFKPTATLTADEAASQAQTEIVAGTHQLETLLCASIDRNFDKFELYALQNILRVHPPDVAPYIRLSHYDGLDFSTPATAEGGDTASDKPSLDSIDALRRRLRESMRLNALLHAEKQRNARLLADLHTLLHPDAGKMASQVKAEEGSQEAGQQPNEAETKAGEPALAFLQKHAAPLRSAGSDAPLSTNTEFTLSQLQSLRALSTSLRTLAPGLAQLRESTENVEDEENEEGEGRGSANTSTKKKSWRRERLEYVEGATKRHLEHVQGLEIGKDGEVRDGEWQGEGRKLGRGEVEGLERMVAILGERKESSGGEEGERMDES